ncbi:MAG TPA: hypothetical protein VM243_11905 [Phycisphaerae bacterium]|nr:hypothetical protein [Phycisphaerae bacterium]
MLLWLMNLGFAGGTAIAYSYPDYPRFAEDSAGYHRPGAESQVAFTRPAQESTGGFDRP